MRTATGTRWESLPDLLTVDEVAAACRIGRNTAYELTHQAGFPVVKLGRRLLIPRAALERWLENQAEGPLPGERPLLLAEARSPRGSR